jgi:hypothetical protein
MRHRFQASFRRALILAPWRLGFRQSSFSHITRVPQRAVPYAWAQPSLFWHAIVPFRFPFQVSHQTQEPPFESLPAAPGIYQSASRRRRGMRVWFARGPGLLTWSEIWCDVDNSERFRSSWSRHVSQGHRLKGDAALHNFLASIFTAPGVTTWRDISGKHQKEPGHQARDTASPVDNVRSPEAWSVSG